jgi:hypothetical protein
MLLAEELADAFSADSLFDTSVFLQETITKMAIRPIKRARVRVVFITSRVYELLKRIVWWLFEGDRKLLGELLSFTTTVIEYKNNSRIHFSYSDSTSRKIY